jgi:beta-phosphoglucomutase
MPHNIIKNKNEFFSLSKSSCGTFESGKDGVTGIYTPKDKKVEFIYLSQKVLCNVKSALGYPAIYPFKQSVYQPPAKAVLMDLDGTSVHSENFWIYIIARTIATLINNSSFELEQEDIPFVSGHSVSEHLQYCINKYCPEKTVEEAREIYFSITRYEMKEILEGRGVSDAFTPAPNLKEFLLTLKENNIKIGLVTSGLTEKALPEIVSAFRTLELGDPLEFYDAIISAGTAIVKGQVGTLGELAPKPHPWLYAETARVGLGFSPEDACVIALEDSSAGVVSARLAGFPCIGVEGGNIRQSGVTSLCHSMVSDLMDALPIILGK